MTWRLIPLRKKLIAVFIIGLLIGFMLGFGYGVQKGIETATLWGLKLAKNFISIEFDEEEIAAMMWAYKNRIDRCYDE